MGKWASIDMVLCTVMDVMVRHKLGVLWHEVVRGSGQLTGRVICVRACHCKPLLHQLYVLYSQVIYIYMYIYIYINIYIYTLNVNHT